MRHYEIHSYWYRHMLFVMIAHLLLRIRFKKTFILTMPIAKRLIAASLTNNRGIYRKALDDILYYL